MCSHIELKQFSLVQGLVDRVVQKDYGQALGVLPTFQRSATFNYQNHLFCRLPISSI